MIISVASGKGGTGKTLVATNLALSLEKRDSVQLLDCDVEEPDVHIFVPLTTTVSEPVSVPIPKVDEERCTYCGKCSEVCAYHAIVVFKKGVLVFPELCRGCGACTYLCPEKAISEEEKRIGVVASGYSGDIELVEGQLAIGEAIALPLIKKVKEYIKQEKAVIIDVAPGTSCPVVEAVRGSHFCLLVTEPTPFGLNDLVLAVEVTRKLNIPCGVVINRVGVGNDEVENYCLGQGIPILLKIPFDIQIAKLYSRGISLVEGMPQWRRTFLKLFDDIERMGER